MARGFLIHGRIPQSAHAADRTVEHARAALLTRKPAANDLGAVVFIGWALAAISVGATIATLF